MALSRPVTALDNERFTVQSVMLHYAMPVVLVREPGPCGAGERQETGERWGQAQGSVRVETGSQSAPAGVGR